MSEYSEHQANRFLHRTVVLCLLFFIGAYGAYRYTLHRLIETRLDVIRRQGCPATLAELEQWYETPPPGRNAADVLTNAFAHYNLWSNQFLNITYGEVRKRYYPTTTNWTSSVTTQMPRRVRRRLSAPEFLLPIDDSKPAHKLFLLPIMGGTPLPPVNEPIDPDRKNCIAEFLQDNQETLRLLHVGARIRGCRYPSRVTNLDGLALPHLNKVRQGARFFSLETLHHTENGNPDPAVFSVTDSFKYACSLERAPDLIAQLVRFHCLCICLDSLEHLINRTALTDRHLASLNDALTQAETHEAMNRAFMGERCHYLGVVQDLGFPHDLSWLSRCIGLTQFHVIRVLDEWNDFEWILDKPFPERLKLARMFEADYKKGYRLKDIPFCLPPSARTIESEASNAARLRAARVALAIERFRLAHRRSPLRLEELTPTFLQFIPQDPFDGQPIRYRQLDRGYMVYGIGKNGRDDNGNEDLGRRRRFRLDQWNERDEMDESGNLINIDITFRVQR